MTDHDYDLEAALAGQGLSSYAIEDILSERRFERKTALHDAAAWGNPAVIALLLEAGATVELIGGTNKETTPLLVAAAHNPDPLVIRALIKAGANVNQGEPDFLPTPLNDAALCNSNPDIVTALLAAGAQIDAVDGAGQSALHAAARNNHPDVALALLRGGADLTADDNFGGTPLHHAAGYNPDPLMSIALVVAGAPLSRPDHDGFTPLQFAYSRNENPGVAMALLGASAASLGHDQTVNLPFELHSPEHERHALPTFTLDRVLDHARSIAPQGRAQRSAAAARSVYAQAALKRRYLMDGITLENFRCLRRK